LVLEKAPLTLFEILGALQNEADRTITSRIVQREIQYTVGFLEIDVEGVKISLPYVRRPATALAAVELQTQIEQAIDFLKTVEVK